MMMRKWFFLQISYAIAKAAGAELLMILEDLIGNAKNLVTDGCNMKRLFILHVLGKYIITQY